MYKIAVKIEGIERRKRSTGFLHVIAGFFLVISAGNYYKYQGYENFLNVLPVYAVALLSLVYGVFRKKIDPAAKFNHWVRVFQFLTFTVLGIAFISLGNKWNYIGLFLWAIAIMFLMFTERKVFHDTDIVLKKDGVFVPGYFSSHQIPWNLIEDLVVRADYLTIFRTNKKYVQLEIMQQIGAVEIAKLNAFCKEQIENNTTQTEESN